MLCIAALDVSTPSAALRARLTLPACDSAVTHNPTWAGMRHGGMGLDAAALEHLARGTRPRSVDEHRIGARAHARPRAEGGQHVRGRRGHPHEQLAADGQVVARRSVEAPGHLAVLLHGVGGDGGQGHLDGLDLVVVLAGLAQ